MKNLVSVFLHFVILLNIQTAFGQYDIILEAYILDTENKNAIPYVNVGFVDKSIGTVTDEWGKFYLRFDENLIGSSDLFKISSTGYESLLLTREELFDTLENTKTLFLKPTRVNSIGKKNLINITKRDIIGYPYSTDQSIYWNNKKALGSEIASLVRIRKKNTVLHNLRFQILENTSDSLMIRVNLYSNNNKKPGKSLLSDNIFHTVSKKRGEEVIDLSAYSLALEDDFIISLELVQVYGDEWNFAIKANDVSPSFLRQVSQDKWEKTENLGVDFEMEVSVPMASQDLISFKKPDRVVLYWDISLSMQDRNLEKEFDFLKRFFLKIGESEVDVVTFSDRIIETKTFSVIDGENEEIFEMLGTLNYNGASNFSSLFNETKKPDQYLVFTDGIDTYGKHKYCYDTPVFYINSKWNASHTKLLKGSYYSNGDYLDLYKISSFDALGNKDNQSEFLLSDYKEHSKSLTKINVFSDSIPLQGCVITVKGTLKEAVSDSSGSSYLKVEEGEILIFRHFAMKKKELVYKGANTLRVNLDPKYEKLNEVTLNLKKKSRAEEIVNLGMKKANKSNLGFTTYSKNRKDFPPGAITLFELINGQFPGVRAYLDNDGDVVITARGRNSINFNNSVLFVVDRVLQLGYPNHLNASQIESISLIPGIRGSILYGPYGKNGVFVIETIGSVNSENTNRVYKDTLLVQDNDYSENILLLDANNNMPEYLRTLHSSSNEEEAVRQYYKLRKDHENQIPFYVHSALYFKRWNQVFSEQIISNIAEIAVNNFSALRTLAFFLEEGGNIREAKIVYESILDVKPDYVQSYLDLANIYKKNKEYVKAFDLYKRILDRFKDNDIYTEVRKQTENELRHLLTFNRTFVNYSDVPKEFLSIKGVPVRLVFDWNNINAEFELQFVTPDKKYRTWTHGADQNLELLENEIQQGIISKEFIIDDSFSGEWLINIKSLGESSLLNPSFMKYTVYRNFGLANETEKVKFIKLYNQKNKVTLEKIKL
ncbi:hypothetical protein [Aquimarina celericrescens]|uniref:TonB-dependent receptor plug domain-containing protein n=1 Tax=Aquimarina celericrescens TaxID=1964542 RepID=A0ABW5AVK3_9FLAO|nr:hypothetical protein [Aquimarina celericrescens]